MSKGRRKDRTARLETRSGLQPGDCLPASPRLAPVASTIPGAKTLLSRRVFWISLVLIAATAVVYAPVRRYEFVALDDPAYVSENPSVSGGLTLAGAAWAFTTGYAANWHPVTWLSHMADVQLFGKTAGRHHLTNLVLHIANAVLLFMLLSRMTGALGRSAFVAGLFALHPLHVESVAWVAERKDVLSTLFWILAIGSYVAYVTRPRPGRYLWLLLVFALGLMAKPMLVTLPFVLLLLDVWPLGRLPLMSRDPKIKGGRILRDGGPNWGPLLREKVPLFVLALISGILTIWVQRAAGAVAELQKIPFGLRVENALVSYVAYIGKMFWPARLAILYPFPPTVPGWQVAGAAVLLVVLSMLAVRQARHRPYLTVGWFWYLGTLLPVIGLIQVGLQAMADRYSYVPLVGLFLALSWGIPDVLSGWAPSRRILPAAACLALLACAVVARIQVGFWKDSSALWQRELEAVLGMDKSEAQNAVAAVLRRRSGPGESPVPGLSPALSGLSAAEIQYDLGLSLARKGRPVEAAERFSEAVRLNPGFVDARINLSRALASLGNADKARVQLSEAVRLSPDSADARRELGLSLLKTGSVDEAVESLAAAVRLRPDFAEAQSDLGFALSMRGDAGQAIEHLTEAVRLKPDLAEAHNNLGTALVREGKPAEALPHFAEAVRLKPDFELARRNLGISLANTGRIEEAVSQFREVLRINPQNEEIRQTLSAILQRRGQSDRR